MSLSTLWIYMYICNSLNPVVCIKCHPHRTLIIRYQFGKQDKYWFRKFCSGSQNCSVNKLRADAFFFWVRSSLWKFWLLFSHPGSIASVIVDLSTYLWALPCVRASLQHGYRASVEKQSILEFSMNLRVLPWVWSGPNPGSRFLLFHKDILN